MRSNNGLIKLSCVQKALISDIGTYRMFHKGWLLLLLPMMVQPEKVDPQLPPIPPFPAFPPPPALSQE